MTHNDKIIASKLRKALMKRDCGIHARSSFEDCKRVYERVAHRQLSETPAAMSKEISQFAERGIGDDMPKRPFVPLVGYQASLQRHRELAEMVR